MSMLADEFDKMRTVAMDRKEANAILKKIVREQEVFTDNELPQKNEQSVKEYKHRISEVHYERVGLQGVPMGRGTIEVLGEKKVYADTLMKQIKLTHQILFSGSKAVVFQFNDNMQMPSDQGKRILVTSSEMGLRDD